MGKIFTRFAIIEFPKGIDSNTLDQIFGCLPDKTFIDSIILNSTSLFWEVHGHNVGLKDKTEIVGKWKKDTYGYSSFNGIDIVDPPVPAITSFAVSTNASFTAPSPGKYTISIGGIAVGSGSGLWSGSSGAPAVAPTVAPTPCDCGKEKSGAASHTGWCSTQPPNSP